MGAKVIGNCHVEKHVRLSSILVDLPQRSGTCAVTKTTLAAKITSRVFILSENLSTGEKCLLACCLLPTGLSDTKFMRHEFVEFA